MKLVYFLLGCYCLCVVQQLRANPIAKLLQLHFQQRCASVVLELVSSHLESLSDSLHSVDCGIFCKHVYDFLMLKFRCVASELGLKHVELHDRHFVLHCILRLTDESILHCFFFYGGLKLLVYGGAKRLVSLYLIFQPNRSLLLCCDEFVNLNNLLVELTIQVGYGRQGGTVFQFSMNGPDLLIGVLSVCLHHLELCDDVLDNCFQICKGDQ
mmetsp:Transcript_43301/g.99804  ORF Transcript_43301/g.99804 Transcript_43301/m.99804 type:complete len:212 (-) Transcript_43301:153-788(-)